MRGKTTNSSIANQKKEVTEKPMSGDLSRQGEFNGWYSPIADGRFRPLNK